MPANGRVVDLDRARAARHEAAGDPVTLKFGGEEFELPVELPFAFVEHAQEGSMLKAVRDLLGDQADRFFAQRPSFPDIEALAESILPVYGLDAGEASASSSSSATAGTSSRPTSNASTD